MPEYRRWYESGGMFFLTIVTHERRQVLANDETVNDLREIVQFVQRDRPFDLLAHVVMPDHVHWLMQLPEGDTDYSFRVGRVKALFTKRYRARIVNGVSHAKANGGQCPPYPDASVSLSRSKHRDSDVWQRRFWEHTIRNEDDFKKHVDYIHFNPVKHEVATCPHAWTNSSFEQWVKTNFYEPDWNCQCDGRVVKAPRWASTDIFGE